MMFPINSFNSVAENMHPISYAKRIFFPNVCMSLFAAAMGYLALLTILVAGQINDSSNAYNSPLWTISIMS